MKKISIVLAILAVFLVFSCSNAAGAVDVAGNPVDLAGSWSGSVAYKSAVKYVKPVTFKTEIDFTGSWVKETVTAPTADYDSTSTTGTVTTTTKYLYNGYTTTTTTTRVIAEDGSYVNTEVVKQTRKARDAIAPVANTNLVIDGTWYYYVANNQSTPVANDPAWANYDSETPTYLATIPAVVASEETETTATTVAIAKQANNKYTETATKKYSKVSTVGTFTTKVESTDITVTRDTNLTFSSFSFADYVQTKTGKKPVEYFNDITETLTLEVAKDGTYTLKSVAVETQAAAAAAAATDTAYAAAERKAATLTYTTTTKGTVAAWETTTSADGNTLQVAFSSSAKTVEVAGTENFKDKSKTTGVSKFAAGKYTAKLLKGTKDKDVAAKTRLYLKLDDLTTDATEFDDAASNVIIFDKAPEAAK